MDKQNVLITGATGFIGGFLRQHYSQTHTVFAPGHSTMDLTNTVSVNRFFEKNQIDTVIHCALVGRDRINAVDATVLTQNLEMFNNLWHNRQNFGRLINCGTGNEFDTNLDLDHARESTLFDRMPIASYGTAKNLIARIIEHTPEFYNLRLFGVFHYTENPRRFFQRLRNATANNPLRISQDHEFDFFNLEDIMPMIDIVMAGQALHRDINMVYPTKRLLSEHAALFSACQGLELPVVIEQRGENNFTGDSSIFDSYNIPVKGLEQGFLKY
jgi:GDP-L-fucose synthase